MHTGIEENEIADAVAKRGARGFDSDQPPRDLAEFDQAPAEVWRPPAEVAGPPTPLTPPGARRSGRKRRVRRDYQHDFALPKSTQGIDFTMSHPKKAKPPPQPPPELQIICKHGKLRQLDEINTAIDLFPMDTACFDCQREALDDITLDFDSTDEVVIPYDPYSEYSD